MGRENEAKITAKGNLSANDDVEATIIEIGGSLRIQANLQTEKAIIGKNCQVKETVQTKQLIVGGNCNIAGNLICNEAIIKTGCCKIGGDAKCNNQILANSLEVTGCLKTTYIVVENTCKAKSVSTVYAQVKGDIICETIDTKGGIIYCGGSVTGEIIGGGQVFEHFTDWNKI